MNELKATVNRAWPVYNTIWRWHFYAGLFCIPFVLVLAITGGVYLFKPQVTAALDAPFAKLNITGVPQMAAAQVNAALRAVPNAAFNAYELPQTSQSAVQVLVGKKEDLTRVYVHPQTLQILKIAREDDKFMQVMHELHGNLLVGNWGSYLIELAAAWAIVMLITGLYLWWPSNMQNMAGIVYPRLKGSQRVFWRDCHAVTGFWIAFFTLFLLLSGLPWAVSWGGLLKEVRSLNAGKEVQQDWVIGRNAMSVKMNMSESEHAEHMKHLKEENKQYAVDYNALDRMVATVRPLNLAYPVQIYPPSKISHDWTAKSKSQNRPLRADLVLDAKTGAIKSRKNFADRPLLDRIIGYGIAIHEGQLFGWFNQLLGLITSLGLVVISVSGVILWWRRRLPSTLGAPSPRETSSIAIGLIAIIILLGVILPFLGISLLLVLLVERYVLRNIPAARNFLGLT